MDQSTVDFLDSLEEKEDKDIIPIDEKSVEESLAEPELEPNLHGTGEHSAALLVEQQ